MSGAATFPPHQHQQQQRQQQFIGGGPAVHREQSYDFDYSLDDDGAAAPPGYVVHGSGARLPPAPAAPPAPAHAHAQPNRLVQGGEKMLKVNPKPQLISRAPVPSAAVLKAMPAALR